jgi:hypothetical protein
LRFTATVAVAAAVALVASASLGAAAAEAPTTAAVRTISVGGVAVVPIAQSATEAAATAAYRQAMAAAVNDGQSKAQFLAEKTGVALGPVQAVAEGGGSISCTGGDESNGYAEYEGAQPDFSSGAVTPPIVAGAVAPRPATRAPSVRPRTNRKRRHTTHAKAAVAGTCKLSAQVSLVYTIA